MMVPYNWAKDYFAGAGGDERAEVVDGELEHSGLVCLDGESWTQVVCVVNHELSGRHRVRVHQEAVLA